MAEYDLTQAELDVAGSRLGVIAARFNHEITDGLLSGALATLVRHGIEADATTVLRVPGAFELPLAAQRLAASHQVDAIITLGAVVRGGTPHFEYVCRECAAGVMRVGLDFGLPVIFGVLTTDTMEQALQRVGGEHGHKGEEAALAALETLSVLKSVNS